MLPERGERERGGWAGRWLRRILYEERDGDGRWHSKKRDGGRGAANFARFPFYSNRRGMQPSFVSLFFNKDSWICMIGYLFSGIFSISTPRICHLRKLSFSKLSSKEYNSVGPLTKENK